LRIELPEDPAIALLGICPKDTKMLIRRGTCTPCFSSTINNSQIMKEPTCPSTDQYGVYIYTMEYYSAIKKNEILPFATMWMELQYIRLSE
ncbi:LORF2 protein, partial [Crocuta crocuta]